MKLRMHGFYDKIIDHLWHEDDTEYIDCYDDSAITSCNTPKNKSIALVIEPRSIMPNGYKAIENGWWAHFKYVYTHDSKLLREIPNARLIHIGGVWSWSDEPKTKFCSLVCSFKEMCELHMIRKELAYKYENSGIVDVYGDYKGRGSEPWIEPSTYLRPYRFSIVIENYIDDEYFTEKICNCFANKVVPIYLGARNIDKRFNKNGILIARDKTDIEQFIESINRDPEYAEICYNNAKAAIEDNYKRVKMYRNFEERFFLVHGLDLEQM